MVDDGHLEGVRAALAYRYRIERELGRGTFATVFLADDLKYHREVAIKVLKPEWTAALGRDRFLLEIQLTAQLNHPNILPLLDSDERDGFLFFVMPYVAGESLRYRLRQEKQLAIDEAIRITRDVADALAAAHARGVLHRDIKPENILLHAGHAMVADFGIARALAEAGGGSSANPTTTGIGIGTPGYMSPEQAAGERNLDQRTDEYSLACVLYEMLVGEMPFTGKSTQAIFAKQVGWPPPSARLVRDTVTPLLDEAIRRALAKVRADRYPGVAEFARALTGPPTSVPVTDATASPAVPPAPAIAAPAVPTERSRDSIVEQRRVTVLSCRLCGANELDPQDVPAVMGRYQEVCAECIKQYDGRVSERRGDAVEALFGFPVAHEDDAERVVHAGLKIIETLGKPEAGQLSVRIGIARGKAVVSGDDEWVEAKDFAFQLRDLGEPGSIVVSDEVQRLAGGRFTYKDLGEQTLKGVAAPAHVYRVVDSSTAPRFETATKHGLTGLVGRRDDIGLLRRRWRAAQKAGGQVVLLVGEPGIGKSRIVSEFFREDLDADLEARKVTALRFQCSPYHTNSAFYPCIDFFEQEVAFERDEPLESRLKKLTKLMVVDYRRPASDVGYVAALLSIPHEGRSAAIPMSPQRRKEQTIEALVNLTHAAAHRRLGVMLFEDVHWADPSTIEVLDRLVSRAAAVPLLVVLTSRSPEAGGGDDQTMHDFRSRWSRHMQHFEARTIDGLTSDEVRELVSKVTRGKALPPRVQEYIVETTDGVPLFVEELTKTILESGALRDDGARYGFAGDPAETRIPATLSDALMARLDRVAPARGIAQIGAAIGREFSYDLIAAVAPVSQEALDSGLARLTESGLASRRGDIPDAVYTFKHALVQKAAYEWMLPNERRKLHATIARELEKHWPETKDTQPAVLARHYTDAGLPAKAVPYWQHAGDAALKRFALVEAVAHLRTGLALVEALPPGTERDRLELQLRELLGRAVMDLQGWATDEVSSLLEPALDLARSLDQQESFLPVLHGLWVHFMSAGRHAVAMGWATQMEAQAVASDKKAVKRDLKIVAYRAKMTSHFWMGDLTAAAREGQRIEDEYNAAAHGHIVEKTNADPLTAEGIYRSQILWMLGYPEQAIAKSDTKDKHARKSEHPHPIDLGLALTLGASVFDYCGRAEDLLARGKQAEALGREHRVKLIEEKMAPIVIGVAALRAGSYAESADQIAKSLSKLTETGHRAWVPYVRALLGEALARSGDLARGLACIEESLEQIERQEERVHLAEVLRLKGWMLMQQGRSADAEACLRGAIGVARQQKAKSWELRATTTLAHLLADRGDRAGAHQLLRPAYRWFKEGFGTKDLKDAKALLDELES